MYNVWHDSHLLDWLDSNLVDFLYKLWEFYNVWGDSDLVDIIVAGYEDPWPPDPGPATDNNGTTPPGSLLRGVHPLPHTDLTVRTLPDVRGTSGHLPDRSTGAPARLHDHLPPRPAPLTGTPNGGLPYKHRPPGHDGKSGFPWLTLTTYSLEWTICISWRLICLNVQSGGSVCLSLHHILWLFCYYSHVDWLFYVTGYPRW